MTKRATKKNLETAESILITNHEPSFNKEQVHDISTGAKKVKAIIINIGNNRILKICCPSFFW